MGLRHLQVALCPTVTDLPWIVNTHTSVLAAKCSMRAWAPSRYAHSRPRRLFHSSKALDRVPSSSIFRVVLDRGSLCCYQGTEAPRSDVFLPPTGRQEAMYAVSPLPGRESRRAPFLRRVRGTIGPALLVLRIRERARGKILRRLWYTPDRGAPRPGAAGPRSASIPSSASQRENPHLQKALEGERKQVTVLFADLKGSMELLADRDPEEARQLLDPGAGADDGGRPSLRRHGEPGHGRRHHGPVWSTCGA